MCYNKLDVKLERKLNVVQTVRTLTCGLKVVYLL